jgi:hypothetical protein
MATIYDESNRNDKMAGLIKEYSRMKYGRKRVFVDQEIEDRIGINRGPEAPAAGAPGAAPAAPAGPAGAPPAGMPPIPGVSA